LKDCGDYRPRLASLIASSSVAPRRSISASVIASGGMTTIVSPSGRSSTPRSRQSRHTRRPTPALAGNARRLARGEELPPIIAGNDEVAQLDRAFHDMAQELSRSQHLLRDQVQVRESILNNIGDEYVAANIARKAAEAEKSLAFLSGQGDGRGAQDWIVEWVEDSRREALHHDRHGGGRRYRQCHRLPGSG